MLYVILPTHINRNRNVYVCSLDRSITNNCDAIDRKSPPIAPSPDCCYSPTSSPPLICRLDQKVSAQSHPDLRSQSQVFSAPPDCNFPSSIPSVHPPPLHPTAIALLARSLPFPPIPDQSQVFPSDLRLIASPSPDPSIALPLRLSASR